MNPDHINIDPRTTTVRIAGPMTKEEKVFHDHWIAQLKELRAKLKELLETSNTAEDPAMRLELSDELNRTIVKAGEVLENPPLNIINSA